ncbi:VIT domain-containing protein, partial [Rhizobium johnstonii]
QEAREIYEQANAEGKKTALLEQQRPNIFTNQVANICPGETIVVQIEYQQTIHQSGGGGKPQYRGDAGGKGGDGNKD